MPPALQESGYKIQWTNGESQCTGMTDAYPLKRNNTQIFICSTRHTNGNAQDARIK